jgi:hypothetical protein
MKRVGKEEEIFVDSEGGEGKTTVVRKCASGRGYITPDESGAFTVSFLLFNASGGLRNKILPNVDKYHG